MPSSTRSVTVARPASVVSDSRNGKGVFEPSSMWSQAHSESKPSSSARVAYTLIASKSGISGWAVKFWSANPNLTGGTPRPPSPLAAIQGRKGAARPSTGKLCKEPPCGTTP